MYLSSGITCPDPPPSLDNGEFTLSSSNIVGSVATYTCNEGYRFNTIDTIHTCQMNEMWSMEDIQCEKGWEIRSILLFVNLCMHPLIRTLKSQIDRTPFAVPNVAFVYNSTSEFRTMILL